MARGYRGAVRRGLALALAFGVGACGDDHPPEAVPPRLAPAPVAPAAAETAPLPTPRVPVNASPAVAPVVPPASTGMAQVSTPGLVVDARLLVISADGSDSELAAIRQTLDYLGTPYDVLIANQPPTLTAADLGDGPHGKYNGIILTRGNLVLGDGSGAFTNAEFETLTTYEATFKVRRVSLYTMPDAGYGYAGFSTQDTSALPLGTQCTAAGRTVFPYVNCAAGVTLAGSFAYPATLLDAATTALLVDGGGRVLAATRSYPNGREALTLNFAQAPSLFYTLQLFHGVVSWVTRGVFLGERHAYIGVQVDDVFLPDVIYTGGTYRMTTADLQAAFDDQSAKQAQPTTAGMRYHMAFNGVGAVGSDPLTALAQQLASGFYWISHTYDHLSLDPLTYAEALPEFTRNAEVSGQLGLTPFATVNLVTPAITGLGNPEAMRAAVDGGIRYLVSDTSQPGQDNPSPNAGIYNAHQPQILEIPRRPVNLYFNVSTPGEWTTEYNDLYRSFWGRDLTYDEILGHESDVLAQYLLRGENDPWMFHQPNLRLYDGGRSLLGDLLERTFSKYSGYVTVPLTGPTMDDLGARVADRMTYNASGATGTIDPTAGTITIKVANAATVPVTGACGANRESYAGQAISYVPLSPGASATLPLATGEVCGQAALSLPCTNLAVSAGAIGPGQTAAALTNAELTGTADVWTDYVELFPASQIVCSYDLPAGVAAGTLTSLALAVNYRGPTKATMTWTFEVLDNATGLWTEVGDNGFAGAWVWTPQVFALPAPFDRFFSGSTLQLRYGTTSDLDASALDQLVITALR